MAAPSSAQTRPSQSASTAPKIQPRMACGPPAAVTASGMVMNGPTPTMSIMFSAVACFNEIPRSSCSAIFYSIVAPGMREASQVLLQELHCALTGIEELQAVEYVTGIRIELHLVRSAGALQ